MTPEEAKALREPFPPAVIGKLPKAGLMLDYVGHAAVVDRLIQVDPEWTWEPFAVDHNGLPALDKDGNLWIRLTICGVTRVGVGDGSTSAKQLVSDALRNAAMRFGVALDLWSKEDLSHNRSTADYEAAVRQLDDISDVDLLLSLHAQAVALARFDDADAIRARGIEVKAAA